MAKAFDRRALIRNHGPMLFFGLLTISGIVFIWTAKLWALNTTFVTAVPILIMLTYFLASLIANSMRLHNEQAGDNLYYMGFLFTLSSLGVSLYRFVGDASIDDIVRNFGIAVTSTICGIAFRILFNQMRRDPLDIERSVRHELAEMTRRVRSELDSSAREFSSYRRSSSQMLLEGFEEIGRQAEQTGAAVHSAIETLSRESLKPIQEASEKLTVFSNRNLALFEELSSKLNVTLDGAASRLGQTTDHIGDMVQGLGQAVEAVSTKLAAMTPPDEMMRDQLRASMQAMNDLAARQTELAEKEASRFNEQISRATEALASLTVLSQRLAEALEPIGGLRGQRQGRRAGSEDSPPDAKAHRRHWFGQWW